MFSFLAYINDTAIATKYKQSEHSNTPGKNHWSLVTRACNFQACGCISHDLFKAARSHGCLTGEAAIFKLR